MTRHKITVKKGMASLYLVAFTTLLLGIVALSFTEIMVTESRESSNSELSQSAYDSAMAGVEDARLALLKYKDCIARGFTSSGAPSPDMLDTDHCMQTIELVENKERVLKDGEMTNGSCDIVSKILGRDAANGEVIIQETDGSEANTNQAYTCVMISEESDDYRSTLTTNDRIRVVPIHTKDYELVEGVKIQWYSASNDSNGIRREGWDTNNTNANKFLPKTEAADKLPIITAELFQTDKIYTMAEMDINNSNNSGTDHAMITLYPENSVAASDSVGTFITARNLLDVSNKSSSAAIGGEGVGSLPKMVSCGYDNNFRCRSTLQFPATYQGNTVRYDASQGPLRSEATFFLRITLPYGTPNVDFSVTLCKHVNPTTGECDVTSFNGVQAVVDSTGRASTLYRRVEARLDLVDANFPYPEFAIQLTGDGALEKDFWVAKNCWTTADDGQVLTCPNNGNADQQLLSDKRLDNETYEAYNIRVS